MIVYPLISQDKTNQIFAAGVGKKQPGKFKRKFLQNTVGNSKNAPKRGFYMTVF